MSLAFDFAVDVMTHQRYVISLDKFSSSRMGLGKTKLQLSYTSLTLFFFFCLLPLFGRHMTSLNKNLSSLTPFGGWQMRDPGNEVGYGYLALIDDKMKSSTTSAETDEMRMTNGKSCIRKSIAK